VSPAPRQPGFFALFFSHLRGARTNNTQPKQTNLMKAKAIMFTIASLVAGIMPTDAAIAYVSNVWNGPGDMLHAYSNNALMNSGLVTIGYFPAEVTRFDIDTIPELYAKLSSFTVITSARPGSYSPTLYFAAPGYVDQLDVTRFGDPTPQGPLVTTGSPLLGRTLYSIVTDAPSLGVSTLMSEFALVQGRTIITETYGIQEYYASIGSLQDYAKSPSLPIIGTIGTFQGDVGLGEGLYYTLKMSYVPEPSTALLGALGVLGALGLRRR
jgi:hypothetical protein